MKTLRLSSVGIRGLTGEALTPETVIDFASAFGTFLDGGRVLVGRDTRLSSPLIHAGVTAGLLATGCEVLDLGICPSPMLQFAVAREQAKGAIAISAGHMRLGWNAIVLISANGAYLDPVSGEAVLDIFHARDFRRPGWNGIGTAVEVDNFATAYFDALESQLDTAAIRRARLTVVVDPVNGAACRFLTPFAQRLGFDLVAINGEESGFLAHDPEPRPRNARQVAAILPRVHAQVGFVASSDFSRISIVTDEGETASEEYTFPLVADHVLRRNPGVLVTNCCTTRMADDVAAAHASPVVKVPVGQAHILAALADENGVIGGEGNGSVAVPRFSRACDGFLTIGLILESLAQRPDRISSRLHELPQYHIVKRQVYGEPRRCYRALESLQGAADWCAGARLDRTDGLRADWDDGWVHVRASETEPMNRIISESRARPRAEARAMEVVRRLEREL
jgi:phosphomannomutase